MRVARWVVPVAVISVMATAVPARGASPASGTVSREQRTVKWSGGPFYAPRPVGCLKDDPTCDRFYVRVKLGHGAKISVRLVATNPATPNGPAPVSGDDYDLYVWSPQGALIAESNRPDDGDEALVFTYDAKYGDGAYEIEVIPFVVAPGSTYTASARALSLGRLP